MGRKNRLVVGGLVNHVLNRSVAGTLLFEGEDDYRHFEQIIREAVNRSGMRLLAYCLMPNHWHLLPWPSEPESLSRFMGWLTMTHSKRRHSRHGTSGQGHLYQGRFKSFPIQHDDHFYAVCRYIERNALRAGLVARAEDWPWCSLYHREQQTEMARSVLSTWPMPMQADWARYVNLPQTALELSHLRHSVQSGCPFGAATWREQLLKMTNKASGA